MVLRNVSTTRLISVKNVLDQFYRDRSYNGEVYFQHLLHTVSMGNLKFP